MKQISSSDRYSSSMEFELVGVCSVVRVRVCAKHNSQTECVKKSGMSISGPPDKRVVLTVAEDTRIVFGLERISANGWVSRGDRTRDRERYCRGC